MMNMLSESDYTSGQAINTKGMLGQIVEPKSLPPSVVPAGVSRSAQFIVLLLCRLFFMRGAPARICQCWAPRMPARSTRCGGHERYFVSASMSLYAASTAGKNEPVK
jgi:hypothetical protein